MENFRENIANQLAKLNSGNFTVCSPVLLDIDKEMRADWDAVHPVLYFIEFGTDKPETAPDFWIESWVEGVEWCESVSAEFESHNSQIS